MKIFKRNVVSAVLLAGFLVPGLASAAGDIDWDLYGSLRLGAEAVDTDGPTKDYTGLRDAYSRFGAKATYAFDDDWSLMGQLEAPFDIANMELQSPWDPNEQYRIAKLQVNGPIGTAWYGRGWLAFYNYITYPVDYFSSYYSGWQTYTAFRKSETFYYGSPTFAGFKFDYSYSDEDNNDRNQFVVSYSDSGINLAVGRDDYDGATIDGASASYSTGPWYMSLKYENSDPDAGADQDTVAGYLQYKMDEKNTLKGYLAEAEGVGETVYHLGFDHQYNDATMFFAEYYDEEGAAAVNAEKDPNFYNATGGSVFTVGVRYDFASN